MRNPRARWQWLLAAILVVAVLLNLIAGPLRQAPRPKSRIGPAHTAEQQPRFERMQSFAEAAKAGRTGVVRIGLEITNVYNLSLADQTFMANGRFWMTWPQTVQDLMERYGIEPDQLIFFVNNIVTYDFDVQPVRKEVRRFNGDQYEQAYRFSGHFWSEDVDLVDFPMTKINLPIRLEIGPEEFSLDGPHPVALVSEQSRPSLVGDLVEISGFRLDGATLEPYVHRFVDDDSFATPTPQPKSVSQVVVSVFFSTLKRTALAQWLLPVAIVMLTVFIAPSINATHGEVRIAVPSTALLTLVVMRQTVADELPPLSYLTFLDVVYIWCYLVALGLFAVFCWGSNRLAQVDQTSAAFGLAVAQVRRVDLWFQRASLASSAVILGVLLVLHL
jgi:hypothetical protein